jgi:hypothetical protein
MAGNRFWLLVASTAATGCLTAGGGGYGDGGDGDADADADVGADADGDADVDADADGDVECPNYPEGPYGERSPAETGGEGDIVAPTLAFPGNGPGDGGEWSMNDFWCMANRAENPATMLVLNVHSST